VSAIKAFHHRARALCGMSACVKTSDALHAKHLVAARVSFACMAAPFLLFALSAQADALQTLNVFLKTTQSAQTAFTQTVMSPAKEGQVSKRKVSKGTFEFIRPHQFRFDYTSPYAQLILADGQTLWVYDKDIAQVTSKPQAQVLGQTPAAMMALASDVSALQKDFVLESLPPSDGLEWVKGTPKKPDGPLLFVRFGLKQTEQGVALLRLEMRDAFYQESTLVFTDFQINPKGLIPERFSFKPPFGVEVIKQ
jgi:outer membrane lipoprotein carrier protein